MEPMPDSKVLEGTIWLKPELAPYFMDMRARL